MPPISFFFICLNFDFVRQQYELIVKSILSKLLSEFVKYPMSDAEILNASDTAVNIVLGANAAARYVNSLKEDARPLIEMHIKVCNLNVFLNFCNTFACHT